MNLSDQISPSQGLAAHYASFLDRFEENRPAGYVRHKVKSEEGYDALV